jgi:hypothetical protein
LTGNDKLLLLALVDKLPLADVLFRLCCPDLMSAERRCLSWCWQLLLSFLVLVNAVRVETWVELAGSLSVGEVAARTGTVGTIPTHRHSRAVKMLANASYGRIGGLTA